MISIKKTASTPPKSINGIRANDELFLNCICEMMENVEKKSKFTSDIIELSQLNNHKRVIRKVLEQNLNLS